MTRLFKWPLILLGLFILAIIVLALLSPTIGGGNRGPLAPLPDRSPENLWNEPLPIPEFLSSISTSWPDPLLGFAEFKFCIGIDERGLWESGDTAGDIQEQLMKNSSLGVDGIRMGSAAWLSLLSVLPYSEEGKVPGSIETGFSLRYELEDLEPGLHIATFRTESTAGREFTHAWAFEVTE